MASRVISWTSTRGRPDEFQPMGQGSAQLELVNNDGAFDPTNSGGPYSGLLVPLKETKINVEHPLVPGEFHDIFTGYADQWAYRRARPTGMTASLSLVDGFEPIQNAKLTPDTDGIFYAVQHVDDRIRAALADIGWPSAATKIATGNVDLQSFSYSAGTSALDVIQQGADAEFPGVSIPFMGKDGKFTFSGRGIRFDPTSYPDWVNFWSVGDAAACADDPTLLPIVADGIEWNWGKSSLYNDIVCAPRGALRAAIAGNHVQAASSITTYGRRSLSLLDLILEAGTTSGNDAITECLVYANYYKNNYASPRQRITRLQFDGQLDDGNTEPGGTSGLLWSFILGVEINDVVTVYTNHPGGGGISGVDYFVEGISNSVTQLNDRIPKWSMSLNLSPRARFASYP